MRFRGHAGQIALLLLLVSREVLVWGGCKGSGGAVGMRGPNGHVAL